MNEYECKICHGFWATQVQALKCQHLGQTKVKFFSPHDFIVMDKTKGGWSVSFQDAASISNAKLAREGKIVYGVNHQWRESNVWVEATHQGLLLDVKRVEICEHPREKVLKLSP